jgi:Na+-translocating ferredoxin:NAD+ oxidoreductase RnfG subunit
MKRRITFGIVLMLVGAFATGLLSGCSDAEAAFKSTSKLQHNRESRNSRAINVVDQAPKLLRK